MTTALESLFARPEAAGTDQQPHVYTYLFCDLMTDTLLAELPLSNVAYSTVLNGIGTMTAHVPYAAETLPLDPEGATVPGRTAVYVDRDGVIVWGGILWTRKVSGSGRDIQCAEFPSYYQHRYVKQTLSTEAADVVDQDFVPDGQRIWHDTKYQAWALVTYAHVQPNGNPRIDAAGLSGTASNVSRTATYRGYERPEIYKAVYDLSQAEDGFDFAIEVGWTSAANGQAPTRYRRWRVYMPRRGRTYAESGLTFAHGGPASSIVDYDWPEPGSELATETTGVGDGDGESTLVRTAQAADMLASGWPLLESVQRFEGVTSATTLQALTNSDLTARSQAATQPTFTVEADADPPYGSYGLGDEALFVIDPSVRMPAGREEVLRIVKIEAAPAGAERIKLTCAAV